MNKKFLTSSAACLVLGIAPTAWAQLSITYPSSGTYSFTSQNTPYSQTVNLPQFNAAAIDPANPSDVILETMSFSVSETASATISVWSTASGQTINSAGYNGYLDLYLPNVGNSAIISKSQTTGSSALILNEAFYHRSLIGTETVPVGQANATMAGFSNHSFSAAPYTYTSSTSSDGGNANDGGSETFSGNLLTTFEGSGTVASDLFAYGAVALVTSVTVSSSYTDNISGGVSVTYDYEVVPEPGTWMGAALLFGAIGVKTGNSWLRRRRQQNDLPDGSDKA
jgi:hypothetical protein